MTNRTQTAGNMSDLITLLGPEDAAKMTRPLTHAERLLVDEALAKHGSASAALGVTDPALAGQVDSLFT